jgi:hypothetical protein
MRIVVSTKKDLERYYLDLFRSTFPSFPAGSIEDGESPDFIICAPDGKIGIELTRIYQRESINRPPQQVQESERQSLVAEARRRYETMKLDPVQVHVSFAGDTHFTKKNRKQYALTIAKLVAKNLPPLNSWLDFENKFDSPESFPLEVHSVNIVRFASLTGNSWSVPVGGFVQEDCRQDFQMKISEKDVLLQKYRACSRQWLLLVAEWSGPSSFFEPSVETLTYCYHASFDRVFFLNPTTHHSSELLLHRGVG